MNKLSFWVTSAIAGGLLSSFVQATPLTEEPSADPTLYTSPIPPKVMIGLAHIPTLADEDPNAWTYVRDHLDGVWVNGAGTGADDVESIVDSLATKNYLFIGSIASVEYEEEELKGLTLSGGYKTYFDRIGDTAIDPKIVIVNDYVTKQASNPLRYYGRGYVREARKFLHKEVFDGLQPFGKRFYITTRSGHFDKSVYDKTYDPEVTGEMVGRAFSTMRDASHDGGWAYERSPIEMNDPRFQDTYIKAFNRSRELGAELIWLANRGNHGTAEDYTTGLVETYQWFKENEIFPDKIVIINYSRAAAKGDIDYLSMLPMENADDPTLPAPGSFTGAMYWAIKQHQNF